MRAIALLLIAACSAPATSPPSHIAAPRAAPTTAPPLVTFESMRLDATRLPAISADGSLVIHTEIDGDGGRGNPNLALVVKDRQDHERERIVVVTANDAEGQYDERGPSEGLEARIAVAATGTAATREGCAGSQLRDGEVERGIRRRNPTRAATTAPDGAATAARIRGVGAQRARSSHQPVLRRRDLAPARDFRATTGRRAAGRFAPLA